MNPDVHWMVVEAERRLLPARYERARRVAEATAAAGRGAPGADRRARWSTSAMPVRPGARRRGVPRREHALDASPAR